MSQTAEERVQTFRDAVNASPELQAKVTAGVDWMEIAQAARHEITAEEIEAYVTTHENDELSDFELEAVAGSADWERRAEELNAKSRRRREAGWCPNRTSRR